ncbi:LysR family transcriptional regulator [Ruegeria sp. R14_0]|uniref:LysR family transcriptional regulator n=1 Tax=Ruegeria sp. R14_0 TaxID=2821100 RepID=UPI001ADBF348|nr:LysR family transcriptional regulator [Ruegeria sp. R14_0]MBO9447014.1 LysR family transcriptional regulator [Ruegeria sp. R14_0]
MVNFNTLDLNLLKVFDALYRERHVGRAGRSIGLAQPSMSNALNRLRAQFDDPLFQRSREGMLPTAKADELAPQIKEALSLISRMLSPAEFDPKQVRADVMIAAADLMVINLAPPLMKYLNQDAPGLRISFAPLDKRSFERDLDDGLLAVALGTFGKLPARFLRQKVLRDQFICITRNGLLPEGAPLTLDTYLDLDHVLMTLGGGFSGVVDHALRRQGLSRRVVMTGTQFAVLPDIVAQSDMVATIPASLSHIAQRAGCSIYSPPLDLSGWDIEMVQTQSLVSDPLGAFIGQAVSSTLQENTRHL